MDFLACASGGVNQVSAGTRPHAALIPAPAMIAYVAETTALVQALTALLRSPQPDYREAGRLLSAAHALLRDQVACSTPLIEECVSRVLAAGAYGAKLSGSGHGGCLFALVPGDSVAGRRNAPGTRRVVSSISLAYREHR